MGTGYAFFAQQTSSPLTLILSLKFVSESRVTWATYVPILVFLGLYVLNLGQMYATDRQTSDRHTSDVRQNHRLMPGA